MQIDFFDSKSVNAWVRKASEDGWKRPRKIVEVARLLDIGFEPGIAYCDVCNRAVVDFNAIESAKWVDDSEAIFLARLEGAQGGSVDLDVALCYDCFFKKRSE